MCQFITELKELCTHSGYNHMEDTSTTETHMNILSLGLYVAPHFRDSLFFSSVFLFQNNFRFNRAATIVGRVLKYLSPSVFFNHDIFITI